MVFIATEDQNEYPKFSQYVLGMVPNARNEPNMFPNMIRAAFEYRQVFDVELIIKASDAMGVGTSPRITWSWDQTVSYAIYEHTTEAIVLNKLYVVKFEQDHTNWGAREFVKATVLHELVHHIDYIVDGAFLDHEINGSKKNRKSGVKERGEYFEELAFGRTVTGSW